MAADLSRIEHAWAARWEDALGLWSRFTKLRAPVWCHDAGEERRESLTSSFAMTRFHDHAVVISLSQIRDMGIEDFPLEVLGHEIGHHVYCPADLTDQARLVARIRRGLPGKEAQAAMIANLYADLLINDRLERQAKLALHEVYRRLGGGSGDRMWTFYMRIYEILWSLDRGSLATGVIDKQIDFDAGLGARLVRVYARDWQKGAGRFAALCFPYLEENDGRGVRLALRGWLDTEGAPAEGFPDGLTEIDDDEEDGAIHPALDPEISGIDDRGEGREKPPGTGRAAKGDTVPRRRYREPAEYREILRGVGVRISDDEITIRYYRERAIPYLVPFPVRTLPDAAEPLPEGLEVWDAGEPIERFDAIESVLVSETIIPGVTTVQRTYGDTVGGLPERQPVDLYLGVDCSGSMSNPALQMSYPVLAGTIMAISALRAGSKVMVCLSGEPGEYHATEGFIRDERAILGVLTGYLGTGFAFGIHRLREVFGTPAPARGSRRAATPATAATVRERPAHVLIVTDHDIFHMLAEMSGGKNGWTVAREALQTARGGGTYVLHMPSEWGSGETSRMRSDGWDVAFVQTWEDVVGFARDFSRRNYSLRPGGHRAGGQRTGVAANPRVPSSGATSGRSSPGGGS